MATQMKEIFQVDSSVEVDGNELGIEELKEAWLNGTIVAVPNTNKNKKAYSVKLLRGDRTIRINVKNIRPSQPPSTVPRFRQGKIVECLKNHVWWKVKMMRMISPGNEYEIKSINPLDDLKDIESFPVKFSV